MGGAVSAGEDNEELVDNLVEADYVKTERIETALRAVDRGNYYLEGYRDTAYKDLAWKNGNLHLSAPCIYSEVLECLKLQPGQSFLNLGSGTGYLSTVAGLLLGTYGINHGVEQHPDVVEYANERLAEFLLNSPAIDIMDFCCPSFVVGNCLQLEPSCSVQAYDRVYCGAAVPAEYLGYIRNMVKVGGIVVMPSGDQLLQIQRVKEDAWDSKSVLPVSFATLAESSAEDRASGLSIILPDRVPLRLQEICRATVREVLRNNIRGENPDFQMRSIVQKKGRRSSGDGHQSGGSHDGDGETRFYRRRRPCFRRVLIPVFRAESDDEDLELSDHQQGAEDNDEDDGRGANAAAGGGARAEGSDGGTAAGGDTRRRLRRPVIAIGTADLSRRSGGRLHMEELRWNRFYVGGNARRGASEEEDSNSREEQPQQNDNVNNTNQPDNGHQMAPAPAPMEEDMRDSLDYEQQLILSGATDTDGHGRSFDEPGDGHPPHTATAVNRDESGEDVDLPVLTEGEETEDDEDAIDLPAIGLKSEQASDPAAWTQCSVASTAAMPTVSSGTGESSKRCHSESEAPELEARRKRAAAANSALETIPPVCQPWRGGMSDSSDVSDAESETHREQQRRSRHENVNMQKKFSEAMTAKIMQLPVPDSVKAYLNYYRK